MPNCSNCGAPMRAGDGASLVCDHCGSLGEPALVPYDLEPIGESAVACPHCKTKLTDARIEGCPVRYCPSCHGLLVEMRHFVTLCDAVRAREAGSGVALPRRQRPGERVLTCPICGQAMVDHLFGGPGNLVLDTCERCQVNWLDPGELRRIARAP